MFTPLSLSWKMYLGTLAFNQINLLYFVKYVFKSMGWSVTHTDLKVSSYLTLTDHYWLACPSSDIAPTPIPGCASDLACPENKVCYNRECKDPCDLANPCAARAKCLTQAHRPICTCDPGYTGNPYSLCSLDVISKMTAFYLLCVCHVVPSFSFWHALIFPPPTWLYIDY